MELWSEISFSYSQMDDYVAEFLAMKFGLIEVCLFLTFLIFAALALSDSVAEAVFMTVIN